MNADTKKEFKSYLWKRWALDVAIRTVKTGAETAAGLLTVGALVSEINWLRVLSVTAVAMLYTVLMNVYKIASDIDAANKIEIVEKSGESGENS